jgi:hypothetical protein
MAEVACFCGCFYSFQGSAGACPGCGRNAAVSTGSQRSQPERGTPIDQAVPAPREASHDDESLWADLLLAGSVRWHGGRH